MTTRTCPRWRCAEVNLPDSIVCKRCGCLLTPLAIGDLTRGRSVFDDPEWTRRDNERFLRAKAREESSR